MLTVPNDLEEAQKLAENTKFELMEKYFGNKNSFKSVSDASYSISLDDYEVIEIDTGIA